MDVQIGDRVKIRFPDASSYTPDREMIITGTVLDVFDALTKDFQEGINLYIDIRHGQQQWFRYKPYIDGGTLTVLHRRDK